MLRSFRDAAAVTLAKPAELTLTVDKLRSPVRGFALDQADLAATVKASRVALGGPNVVDETAVRDLSASVRFRGPEGTATATFRGTASRQDGSTANLDGKAEVTDLLHDGELAVAAATVDAEAQVKDVPTEWVEAATGDPRLEKLVGSSLTVAADATVGDGAASRTVDLRAKAQRLTADLPLRLGKKLSLSDPATATLTVTPEAYEAYTAGDASAKKDSAKEGEEAGPKPAGLTLEQPTKVAVEVGRLELPWGSADEQKKENGSPLMDWSAVGFRATATAERVVLGRPEKEKQATVKSLRVRARAAPLAEGMNGDVKAHFSGEEEGTLDATVGMSDLTDGDGRLDWSAASTKLQVDGKRLPVLLVEPWVGKEGVAVDTVGSRADLTATAELDGMEGPVTATLSGENATAELEGRLADGTLRLTEPMEASLTVTETLGRQLLAVVNPVFYSARSAEEPIRLRVEPEGTRIPVFGFDWEKLAIPEAGLAVGKVQLANSGLVRGSILIAKAAGKMKSHDAERITARFTPVVFSVKKGDLVYKRRLDMLLDNSIHLATWGRVDLGKMQADMTLAIMPRTLDKVFDVEGLSEDQAVRIPLKGPLGKPKELATANATELGARIARRRAQRRLAKNNPFSAALGNFGDKLLGGDEPIPSSSIHPLPWVSAEESGKKDEQAEAPSDKAKARGGVEDLLKGLLGN